MNRRVIYRSATWPSKSIHRHLNITSYFLTVISRSMMDHIGKSLFQLFSQFLTLCSKYCLICFECTNLFFRNTIFIMATITWFLQHVITFVHMIQTWNISTQVSNYRHKKSSVKTKHPGFVQIYSTSLQPLWLNVKRKLKSYLRLTCLWDWGLMAVLN